MITQNVKKLNGEYTMMKPGIYTDISIEQYHDSEGISASGINLILDCPKRYWYEYMGHGAEISKQDKRQKEKFKLGQALHMLILEPDNFHKTFFAMEEEVNLTTKIGKEKYQEAEKEANGREVIRAGDWFDIQEMAKAAKAHPIWKHLEGGKVENSIYWDAGLFNTRLRARPDIYNDVLVVDVKTTDSIQVFQRSIYQYGYHRQAAMQLDGLKQFDNKKRAFGLFVIEKKAPYLTACFTLDEAALQQGHKEYMDGANLYSECLKANNWPGYEASEENLFQLLSLPKWAADKNDI